MTRRIQLTPDASNDLDDEFDYLAERNTDAARRFYVAAQETFSSLAEMPGIGVLRDYQNPQLAGMRMRAIKGFRNYLAFYLTTDDSIQILRRVKQRDLEKLISPILVSTSARIVPPWASSQLGFEKLNYRVSQELRSSGELPVEVKVA